MIIFSFGSSTKSSRRVISSVVEVAHAGIVRGEEEIKLKSIHPLAVVPPLKVYGICTA